MEASKRKRQASNMDVQDEENDLSLSPKAKKSPSLQLPEGAEDSVVILDAGAQYGKVSWVAGLDNLPDNSYPEASVIFSLVKN